MIRMPRRLFACAAFLLLAASVSIWGQGLATLQGTVTDPSGSVVPNAKITVIQTATGLARTVNTDTQGNYLVPSLQPAEYSLSVEAQGFRQMTRTGIVMQADQGATINLTMELGQSTQSISVEAGAVMVDTVTGTQKQVVDSTQMVELPLNGRNAAQLSFLVAGAQQSVAGGALQGVSKQFPTQIVVSTNGVQQDQVSYMLDGGLYNDEFFSTNLPFPFPDALQEFSVQTSNYGAQYGNNAGGVVNIITKSGTNMVHGDLFEFIRNADLNARNTFAVRRDLLKRNQYGFTIGGPLMIPGLYDGKDKTFWFFGYQGTRIRNTSLAQSAFVPTQTELNGDFSAYLNAKDPSNALQKASQIIDPKSGQPFPDNQIPVSRFDPASLGLEKYLPKPPGNGLVFYQVPTRQNYDELVERFDHSFSAKDQVTFRGTWNDFSNGQVYDPNDLVSLTGGSEITSQSYLIHETHIFKPTLLNDLRVTYWRLKSSRGPATGAPNVADLGVQNIYQSQPPTINSISVSGFFSISENPLAAFVRQGEGIADDFSWIRGKHDLKIGFSLAKSRFDLVNDNGANGSFGFTADVTNLAMASYLLGYLRTFSQVGGQPENIRDVFMGYYVQDSYRVSKRFNLSLGLRWEPSIPWDEIRGRINYFKPSNFYAGVHSQVFSNAPVGLLFYGDPGVTRSIGQTTNYKDFMPRIGFAYDLFGDGKTSLRGGTGMFYDTRLGGDLLNTVAGAVVPFVPQFSITTPQGPFSNPLLGLVNPFPAPPTPPKNAAFQNPVVVETVDGAHQNVVNPVVYNWNISLEHQFPSGWLARAAYVGTHGSKIRELVQLNPAVYMPGSTLSTDQRRVFPGYGSITQQTMDANSHYNGLQLSLEKRVAQRGPFHGLTLLANYTWSKAIDTLPTSAGVENTGVSALPYWGTGRRQFDYGVSDFDHTQVMVISYDWQLPSLSGASRLARAVLGRWEVSGILTLQTGDAFTVLAGRDQSQTGLNEDRAFQVGPARGVGGCGNIAPCVDWLNPSDFQLPAVGTFGNVGRNSIRGPGLANWDQSFFKNIPIRERFRVQLRGELFNSLNRVNLMDPGVAPGGTPSSTLSTTSAGFGSIRASADPRIIQFALKLFF